MRPEDHLDLFDDDRSWPDQLIVIRNWLRRRMDVAVLEVGSQLPENIIVHYVGHGAFKPNSEEHLLTINQTDSEERAATSAQLGQLNDVLKRNAGSVRRYYLLDACFAAASVRDLMAGAEDMIEVKVGGIIGAWPEYW